MERLAREQYGLVRPGEVGYVVVVKEAPVAVDTAAVPVAQRDDRPWWQRIWEFVTGSDVDADG